MHAPSPPPCIPLRLAIVRTLTLTAAFTKGFYQVKQQNDGVWLSDLRMGGFGNFVFNFKVGKVVNNSIQAVPENDILSKSIRGNKAELNQGLKAMRERIFDEHVDLFPLFDGAEMIVNPPK